MTEARVEKWCPSCRMRYRLGPPPPVEFHRISMHPKTFAVLLSAAREFDETAEALSPDEAFTAVDFCDWIRASIVDRAA